LDKQGLENPYDKLCGRLAPFMRAHSKLADSGHVSFYGQSTSEVAQRALWENSKDSNGEGENDALTKALQTKEQRGRVRGVSWKLTCKEGFSEHKFMYQKWRTIMTLHVDVEELKR
jgi:hypothetical protein